VVAYDDFDVAPLGVELDGVLQDVEDDFLVEAPVAAGPLRDQVRLHDRYAQTLLLQRVVERRQKVNQHLRDGRLRRLEVAHQLVHVRARVRQLRRQHKLQNLGRAPDDTRKVVELLFVFVYLADDGDQVGGCRLR